MCARTIGRSGTLEDFSERELRAHAQRVREARLHAARSNERRTELEEDALVQRGRVLVHLQTDDRFTPHRGLVFEPHGASVLGGDQAPLWFFVTGNRGDHVPRAPPREVVGHARRFSSTYSTSSASRSGLETLGRRYGGRIAAR